MARREQAVCDICSKEKNCACWDFVVRKTARGRIERFTPGTDTVHYVGGREVGRSRNTTYTVGSKRVSAAHGTAYICIPCRITRSLLYGVLMAVGMTLLLVLLVLALNALKPPYPIDLNRFLPGAFCGCLALAAVFALTPFMRHLILALRLSRREKIRPFWAIVSKFWD